MRRNRKNSIRKERIIMAASSAFVLAALTMTGMYMKEQNMESKDDGYTLDFTALENSVEDKYQEIAQNNSFKEQARTQISENPGVPDDGMEEQPEVFGDDLDYMPLEVGSGQIEIPGLTDSGEQAESEVQTQEQDSEETKKSDKAASAGKVVVEKSLNFSESDGLLRPVNGDILMHYSMNAGIYFATLDQYKYNPAVMIAAQEGTQVSACAPGKVTDIYEDAQIGNAVVLDLGNGYEATYGQLENITVSVNSYVEEGEIIGAVAAPTKYYSVEGSNLYFQLTKDGEEVNPEGFFR